MYSFFSDLFESGHTFEQSELLLKFQYRVINTILLVIALSASIIALLSSLEITPLGTFQTVVNGLLVLSALLLFYRLRGPKKRYLQSVYLMYAVTLVDFISALLFVPNDEFRIIWFYLLIFAAYITGGVRAGNIISVISISVVLGANIFYDLHLSETAIVTSLLGLVIATLFFRAYTKKIIDFERELTSHQEALGRFNEQLAKQVAQKTQELQELNSSLENMVSQKVAQITQQERVLISQSRLATMGEMMSMIAHQWRQPLSTTTLMISNVRLHSIIAGTEPSECEKTLDRISDTIIYLSDTINDFQTYFKPEKDKEEISLNALIERVHHFIEPRLKMEHVQMHIEQEKSEFIETYANELVQVLINIINNAIDALAAKETADRHIWLKVRSDEETIEITIEDNGGGIGEEIIDRVFEPYFSTKSKNGTGLGLYMAMMIINDHINGTLDVENTDKGARFSVGLRKK